MKRICLASLVVLALLAYTVPAAAGNQDFTLVNETGVTIEELHISTVKTSDWQEDVLGDRVLPDDGSVVVGFPVDDDHCRWDLMIVDSDEDQVVFNNLDLCEISTITLYWEDGEPQADLE